MVCAIDADNTEDFNSEAFRSADAAIEFSTPTTAVNNILASFAAGVPVVSGTTGWLDALPDLKDMCNKGKGTLLYGSNFSIGVNVFMAVNRYPARVMNDFPEYTPSMMEIHHIHKLDHPSGTAITLAEDLVTVVDRIKTWQEPEPGKTIDSKASPWIICVKEKCPARISSRGILPSTRSLSAMRRKAVAGLPSGSEGC